MEALLVENVFGEEESRKIMKTLDEEVTWATVHQKGGEVPRLLCIQGEIQNGNVPVYRHPMDDEPVLQNFTPTVNRIKDKLMELLRAKYAGKRNLKAFNHVLIQKYRSGMDFIGEHVDKTIDIDPESVIVNYSLGHERVMTMRSKVGKKQTYEIKKVPLLNDSVFVLDLETNQRWKHSIHRQAQDEGVRISLTFRTISTYWDTVNKKLIGQGAPKNYDPASVDMPSERRLLLHKFKSENMDPDFDWDKEYGNGSPAWFVDYGSRHS